MCIFLIFGFLFVDNFDFTSSTKTTQFTLPVEERVAILKNKIAEQIKSRLVSNDYSAREVTALNEELEYENLENNILTPISENDPRVKEYKYKLRQLKTTPMTQIIQEDDFISKKPQRSKERRKKAQVKMVARSNATDIFYRRFSNSYANVYTHCQDLISPLLNGLKKNSTYSKRVSYDDPIVIRLIQLLTEDIRDHNKEDIHSILYQINNLNLRLFQWDVAAIKLLLNVIDRDKTGSRHSFKSMKTGLKAIFANWKLKYDTFLTEILKQTRLFRPPCISLMHQQGSTQTSRTSRYTKSMKPKKVCKLDEDYDKCKGNDYK